MKLHTDLVVTGGAPERRGRLWLLLGVAVFAGGFVAQMDARGRAAQLDALAREQERAAQQRLAVQGDGAEEARRRDAQKLRNDYRYTFPLDDLLAALESVRGVQLRTFAVTVDEGLVRLDIAGQQPEALAAAVATLEKRLADWDVLLQRQARDGARLVAAIELRDRRRGRTWTSR